MDTYLATPAIDCIDHGQGLGRYGRTTRDGRRAYTHRVVYCDEHGLPLSAIDGVVIRHRCDNERCINGKHLESGTQAENLKDMWERTRVARMAEHYDAIRTEYVQGCVWSGQAALALKYGTSQSHISRIINRKTLT